MPCEHLIRNYLKYENSIKNHQPRESQIFYITINGCRVKPLSLYVKQNFPFLQIFNFHLKFILLTKELLIIILFWWCSVYLNASYPFEIQNTSLHLLPVFTFHDISSKMPYEHLSIILKLSLYISIQTKNLLFQILSSHCWISPFTVPSFCILHQMAFIYTSN